MNQCLCCGDRLIKHLNHTRMYWVCLSHQEMPNVEATRTHHQKKLKCQLITQN